MWNENGTGNCFVLVLNQLITADVTLFEGSMAKHYITLDSKQIVRMAHGCARFKQINFARFPYRLLEQEI